MSFSLWTEPTKAQVSPASSLATRVKKTLAQWSKFSNALKNKPKAIVLPETIDGTAFITMAKAVVTMYNKNQMVPDTEAARSQYKQAADAIKAEGEEPISYHQSRIRRQFGKGAQSKAIVSLYEESGEVEVLNYANALAEATAHTMAVLNAICKQNNIDLDALLGKEEE
jgi:hypothetical protein